MPAALALSDPSTDLLEAYLSAMRGLDCKTGRSTTQAAMSFCAKLERSGSWEQLSLAQQSDAITKARSFVSWLLVTGRLTIAAELMTDVDCAWASSRAHRPETYAGSSPQASNWLHPTAYTLPSGASFVASREHSQHPRWKGHQERSSRSYIASAESWD